MMKSIELRIMGGLGNQLYQYAAARYLQKKYNVKHIVIDSGEYDTYKIRKLEVVQLIHNNSINFKNDKSVINRLYRERYHIYQKLYRMLLKKRPQQKIYCNKSKKYICTYISSDLSIKLRCDILHMYGYFVSAKNALVMKDELMQEIWLGDEFKGNKYNEFLKLVESKSCISVSIRCADDYVKNGWPVCSKKFYQKGLDYILNIKGVDHPILIFADDIDKVKNENWFAGYSNVFYIESLSVCESFEIMRRCSDYVCSNSSFSWWGAFLSYSIKPIRINPNKVFAGESECIDKLTYYNGLILTDYLTGEIVK